MVIGNIVQLPELAILKVETTRNVVAESAHQRGGGNFSSKYGEWEYCKVPELAILKVEATSFCGLYVLTDQGLLSYDA